MATAPVDWTKCGRAFQGDESDCGGLDQLLRPVLPVEVVSPPAMHQHLPDALGWSKIQTAAFLQAVQGVVVRDHRSRPRTVHALAVGKHVRRIAMRRAE